MLVLLGRIDDIGSLGIQLIEDIVTIFDNFANRT